MQQKVLNPENSAGRWIYRVRLTGISFAFPAADIFALLTPQIFYYLCPPFCASLHFPFLHPCLFSHFLSVPRQHFLRLRLFLSVTSSTLLPSRLSRRHVSAALTHDSHEGPQGDRDHTALWNLYAQISC